MDRMKALQERLELVLADARAIRAELQALETVDEVGQLQQLVRKQMRRQRKFLNNQSKFIS